ncbi:hypothetical protein [Enterobacter hormaechei]|uniref:hypothetical protein n=1 Tax=Enterobacter hormaechei TaxID=158836 RepID=UPI0034E2293D
MTDDGLILKSPAGSAHYDLKGRRHTVWGDASFFPEHMRVKDKRKPNLSRIVFEKDCTTIYGADGKAQVRIGNWDNLKEPKGFRIHADGPLSVNHGQAFIDNALIGGSITSANYNVKVNICDKGKQHACGVGIDVQKGKVEFKADDFKITPGVHPSLGDLFMPPQPEIDAKTSELKKAVDEWIGKMIQLHCQPGGMIWHAARRNR